MSRIEEIARVVLKFYQDNCEPHGITLQNFLLRLKQQIETEREEPAA